MTLLSFNTGELFFLLWNFKNPSYDSVDVTGKGRLFEKPLLHKSNKNTGKLDKIYFVRT
jgi:hypothetical protein